MATELEITLVFPRWRLIVAYVAIVLCYPLLLMAVAIDPWEANAMADNLVELLANFIVDGCKKIWSSANSCSPLPCSF